MTVINTLFDNIVITINYILENQLRISFSQCFQLPYPNLHRLK